MGRYDVDLRGEGGGSSTVELWILGIFIISCVLYVVKEMLPAWREQAKVKVIAEVKRAKKDLRRAAGPYLALWAFIALYILLASSGVNSMILGVGGTIVALGLVIFFFSRW